MSDQFPTRAHPPSQPPPFATQTPGTQLSGYFGQSSSDDDNPFSTIGSAATSQGGPPPGGLVKGGVPADPDGHTYAPVTYNSGPITSYGESAVTTGSGFFDSLPAQGQQSVGMLAVQQPAGVQQMNPSLFQAGHPASSGTTGGIFSSTQPYDVQSPFQLQPSSREDTVLPSYGKSPSAPPTGLLDVLPPSDQKPSSCPPTGVLHVLSGTEQESPSVQTPSSTVEYPFPGQHSLSSGHPSLSSGLPSLSSEHPYPPGLPSLSSEHSYPPSSLPGAGEEHSNVSSARHSLTSLETPALTNVESNVSSPHSRPPSNADSHTRLAQYNDPFVGPYQQQTNADPSFNTSSKRGGLKTNLQSNFNPSGQSSETNATVTGDSQPPRSVSEPPYTSSMAAQVVWTEAVEKSASETLERPPSTTSSLNHSICSLLDSQEDFTSNSSPVRLLAPAPFTHEPHPPVGPPISLTGEVKLGAVSLAPPAPLPAPPVGVSPSSSVATATTSSPEEPPVSEQEDPVVQVRAMSNNGTVRLLAEASAEDVAGEKAVRGLEGVKGVRTGSSMSPDSSSKGEGSLKDWEIVDSLAESARRGSMPESLPPPPAQPQPSVQSAQPRAPAQPQPSGPVMASSSTVTPPYPNLSEGHFASPSVEPLTNLPSTVHANPGVFSSHSEAPIEQHHLSSGMHAQTQHDPNTVLTTAGNVPDMHPPLQSIPLQVLPGGQLSVDQSAVPALLKTDQSYPGHQHISSQPPTVQSFAPLSVQPLPQAGTTSSVTAPPIGVSPMSGVDIPPPSLGLGPAAVSPRSDHTAAALIPSAAPQISSIPPQIATGTPMISTTTGLQIAPTTAALQVRTIVPASGVPQVLTVAPTTTAVFVPATTAVPQISSTATIPLFPAPTTVSPDIPTMAPATAVPQISSVTPAIAAPFAATTGITPTTAVPQIPNMAPTAATQTTVVSEIPPITSAPQIPMAAPTVAPQIPSMTPAITPPQISSTAPPQISNAVAIGHRQPIAQSELSIPVVTTASGPTDAGLTGGLGEPQQGQSGPEQSSQPVTDVVGEESVPPVNQGAPEKEAGPGAETEPYYSRRDQPASHYDDYHDQPRDGYKHSYHRDYEPYQRDVGYPYDSRYPLGYPDPADPSYHPRPHSRASYGYPHDHMYGSHHPPDPRDRHGHPPYPPPPHHHHPPGRPGYDSYPHYPPYGDPYRHPREPYYDPYRYSREPYHRYPPDPRHDYPPGPGVGGYPPYDRDAYERDYHDPHHTYEDRYPHETESYSGVVSHSQADFDTQSMSMIAGPSEPRFEESQVMDSPSIRMPAHPHNAPLESTVMEYPGQVPPSSHHPEEYPDVSAAYPHDGQTYAHEMGDGQTYPHEMGDGQQYYQQQYTEDYSNYDAYQGTGYYNQDGTVTEHQLEPWQVEEEAKPITPPPPARETPEIFSCPHVRARFGFGGQLLTVLPGNVRAGERAVVEIIPVTDLLTDQESREFIEAVRQSPGPFKPGETPKNSVVGFASQQAQLCREKREALTAGEGCSDISSLEQAEDEVLFWEFLMLLCQQNGTIMPSDLVDLLMRGQKLNFKSSTHFGAQGQEEVLDALRQLLLTGRKKDALDFACSKSLWGHALMLASRMDDQSRTYVVNRFTASLMTTDPLNTFYTLLLGRTPSCVKPEGLSRAGDWRPHLSMILANKMSKLDAASIVSLGDSLMARKRLHAAHLCYYLGDVHFGSYGDTDTRYSLLGVDHSRIRVGLYPEPQDLHRMEVFEYALCLTKQDFALPAFQLFKLLHVYRLVEYGFLRTALDYCEQIGSIVCKGMDKYVPTFLSSLVGLSVRLHHLTAEFGYMDTDLPSWLSRLQQAVDNLLSTDYSPDLLSPSPAFSSVSQTYSSHGTQQPLVIGLQQDSSHLTIPRVSALTSRAKENVVPPSGEPPSSSAGMLYQQQPPTVNVGVGQGYATGPQEMPQEVAPMSQEMPSGQQYAQEVPSGQQYAQEVPSGQLTAQGVQQYGLEVSADIAGQQYMSSTHQELPGQLNVEQSHSVPTLAPAIPTLAPAAPPVSGQDGGGYYYPPASSDQGLGMAEGTASSTQPGGFQVEPVSSQPELSTGGHYGQQSQSVPDYGVNTVAVASQGNHYMPNSGELYNQSSAPPVPSTGLSQPVTSFPPPAASTESVVSQQEQAPAAEGTGQKSQDTEQEMKSGKDENDKSSSTGSKPPPKPASSGGGWGSSFLKYFVPKKKNQAHLPDDKNPSIVWDDQKKKWVNMDNDGEEEEDFAPPPTDSELHKSMSSAPLTTPAPGSDRVDSSEGGPPGPTGGALQNKYSRQGLRRGHSGIRSKYVDVLNPSGPTSGSQPPGPAPGPPPMMLGGSTFSGTFFVPPSAPDDDGTQTPTPADPTNATSSVPAGSAPRTEAQGGTAESAVNATAQHQQTHDPSSQYGGLSTAESAVGTIGQCQQTQDPSSQYGSLSTAMASETTSFSSTGLQPSQQNQNMQQPVSSGVPQPAATDQPQFFNPSAFARVGGYPGSSETQDDALSTASLMSESSQEVSRYMNSRGGASAGYNRLRQGIRGTGGYPAMRGGVVNQQKPHPANAPPPGPPTVGQN